MTKNVGGRPRKIASPEEMDRLVDAYEQECVESVKPITLTGMIRYMGLSSRQGLDEYLKYEGFYDSVKRAKLLVECTYEERMHGTNPAGAIFALKNMGWSDRHELDHSSSDGSMSPRPLTDFYPSKGKPLFGSGDDE